MVERREGGRRITPPDQHIGPWELRYDEEGNLDEVVGTGTIHLERMDDGHIWIGLTLPGAEDDVHLDIYGASKRSKIRMRAERR